MTDHESEKLLSTSERFIPESHITCPKPIATVAQLPWGIARAHFCTNLSGMSLGHLRSLGKKDFLKSKPFEKKKVLRQLYFFFLSFFFPHWVNVTVEKDLSHPVNHLREARGLNPSYSQAPQTNEPHRIGNVILKMRSKVRWVAGSHGIST